MASEKIVNYTPEQTAQIVTGYTENGDAVETLATQFGKTVRSIVAKLSSEGVYKPKTAAKAKAQTFTKAQLVAMVAEDLGLSATVLESLEKASKPALEALEDAVSLIAADLHLAQADE